MRTLLITLIRAYQLLISPLLGTIAALFQAARSMPARRSSATRSCAAVVWRCGGCCAAIPGTRVASILFLNLLRRTDDGKPTLDPRRRPGVRPVSALAELDGVPGRQTPATSATGGNPVRGSALAVSTIPAVPGGQDVPHIAASGPGAQNLGSSQRVRVVTDLFEAEIDTTGGDLRQVGLRTYPESIQHRDQPFMLFKDSGPDLFIAQSGLVALEHGPASTHYATFSAAQAEYRLADGQDRLMCRRPGPIRAA